MPYSYYKYFIIFKVEESSPIWCFRKESNLTAHGSAIKGNYCKHPRASGNINQYCLQVTSTYIWYTLNLILLLPWDTDLICWVRQAILTDNFYLTEKYLALYSIYCIPHCITSNRSWGKLMLPWKHSIWQRLYLFLQYFSEKKQHFLHSIISSFLILHTTPHVSERTFLLYKKTWKCFSKIAHYLQ